MDTVSNILERARERGLQLKLAYAGALLPREVHELIQQNPQARLVDVRTRAEWDWVGRVPGSLLIEWNFYPDGQRNAQFIEQLESQVPKTDAPVMFLCRSGNRSHSAALVATQAGYPNCFNVLEGFEGDKDAQGHRNSSNGWRVARLPWTQS